MVIGNLASIVKDQVGLVAFSAIAVSALAIGNGAGRVTYGCLSDKIGRKNVMLIAFIFQAVLIFILDLLCQRQRLRQRPGSIGLRGADRRELRRKPGGLPRHDQGLLRIENFAMNYGIVYTAWGLGGFMLSQLAGTIRDTTGNFNQAYLLAAVMLVIAAILMGVLKSPQTWKRRPGVVTSKSPAATAE